jgi:hypothetical protein
MSAHPKAPLRVVTIHRTAPGVDWLKTIRELGIADSPRWTNYSVEGEEDGRLVEALGIGYVSSESYLVDDAGCVIHSRLSRETLLPVIERALAEHESCDGAPPPGASREKK